MQRDVTHNAYNKRDCLTMEDQHMHVHQPILICVSARRALPLLALIQKATTTCTNVSGGWAWKIEVGVDNHSNS